MKCGGCSNEHAYHIVYRGEGSGLVECCDRCGNLGSISVPDVYLGPGGGVRVEENLADPKTGKPIPFQTKKEKAEIMKMLGVREAGDRFHGARNETVRRFYVG